MIRLETLILIAGVLHFGLLIASALTPRVLQWRTELRVLAPLSRQLIWVHGAFLVLTLVGFGVISLSCAAALASGERLARVLCSFIAIFCTARLIVQFFVFHARPYLTRPLLKFGYHGLTFVFLYFAIVYGTAALRP